MARVAFSCWGPVGPALVFGNVRLGIGAVRQGLLLPGNCTEGGFVPARKPVDGTHTSFFMFHSQGAEREYSCCHLHLARRDSEERNGGTAVAFC